MSTFLSALGRYSATHRLVIVIAWLAVLVGFTTVTATSMDLNADPAAGMPATQASKALTEVQEKFPALEQGEEGAKSLTLVLQTTGSDKVTDPAVGEQIAQIIDDAARLPHVAAVSNPLDSETPYISKDLTTAVSTVQFTDITDDNREAIYDKVLDFADAHRATADALTIEVGGSFEDVAGAPEFGAGEIIGVIAAFVVLIITFGTLRAAGANMLVAASGVAVGTVGVLAYSAISPLQSTIITLVTMLGLAVGIDYNLFVISRFRSEVKEGRGIIDAIARATGTAGTAVFFAGLTVIIALAGLTLTGIGSIRDMGLAGAFGVLIAVLMSVTLMPVLLRTLGLKALSKKERALVTAARATAEAATHAPATANASTQPNTALTVEGYGEAGNRRQFLRSWVTGVTKRPGLSAIAAVAVLVVMAIPMFSLKTASSIPGGSDPESTERAAYNLVVDKFGGVQSPLLVLATGEGVGEKLPVIQEDLAGLANAQMVVPGAVNEVGDAALITVIPTGGPIDQSTRDLVHEVRDHAADVTGVTLKVTGETAIGIDTDAALKTALVKYVVVIVVVSILLLLLLFRSVIIPVIATLGFLLSLGVTFGASVAIFQWGWIPLPAPQGDPMLNILPTILTGVLFGLAMDYQVFLVSRIREAHSRGLKPVDAIRTGFVKAGPVLVAAATIMAFVFAGFATSTLTFAASTAAGITVGVLADAFLVRMVLMPALLTLLGEKAWWMPRWLDRILPDVDAEGHALEAQDELAAKAAAEMLAGSVAGGAGAGGSGAGEDAELVGSSAN